MKKIQFLIILIIANFAVSAQTKQISGKVSSSDNNSPLQGVTVSLKNSNTRTITNKDGLFTISADKGSTLVFSHTGYEEMQIDVNDNNNLSVGLFIKTGKLDEVVVIGYGSAKRRDLTGSIARVDYSSKVNTTVTPSFEAGLQGRATGLQIISSNGVPGSAIRVRVRGQNSFTGSGDPLYVVDGVPVYSGDYSITGGDNTVRASNANVLSTIDPADIESIEVLKDAAASAIYGARGANGVIVITTKRGKAGKTQFNASYSIGQSKETNRLELISSQDWWKLYNEARVNDGNAPRDPAVPLSINGGTFIYNDVANVNTDWIDEMLRKGITQDVNISARGGNDKTQFFVGGGFKTQEGILKGNNYDRVSGRVNIDNQATQNFKFGIQSSVSYTDNEQVPTSFGGGLGAAQSTALRLFPVYNPDGTYYGTQFNNTGMNPLARVLNNKYITKSTRFINNIYADFKITNALNFRAEYGLDILDQFEERYDHKINRYFNGAGLAARWERRLNIANMNGNAYFTYKNTFQQKHNITITTGSSIQNSKTKAIGFNPAAGGVGFINDYFNETTSTMVWAPGSTPAGSAVTGYNQRDAYRFLSFFARANYKLNNKYLVGASFRADGSSRFGSNHQFGYFPALSAGWILTEEDFMLPHKFINFLKLRASYGYTGNSEIGNFRYLGTFSSTGGYNNFPGITPTRLPNPDISWEKARQLDVGLDYEFLNGRLTGSLGFYRKISTDVLLDKPAPTSATGLGSILVNAEDVVVRNLGVEFELTAKIISKKDFNWTADFNISSNQNKVLETGNVPPDGFGAAEGDTRVVKGYPIGISFLAKSAGVNPATGNEMVISLIDGKPFDALKQSDITSNRQPLGNPFPDFIGGLNNTLTYKSFELSFLVYFSQGNKIYDDGAKRQMGGFIGTWNQRTEVLTRWQKPGDITNIPKLSITNSSFTGSDRNTSRFLFDASFIRLRSLNFAYNLPAAVIRKAGLSAAKLYVNGSNLLTITKYKGWDPEVVRYNFSAAQANISFDAPYLPTPQSKTLVVGINLSF